MPTTSQANIHVSPVLAHGKRDAYNANERRIMAGPVTSWTVLLRVACSWMQDKRRQKLIAETVNKIELSFVIMLETEKSTKMKKVNRNEESQQKYKKSNWLSHINFLPTYDFFVDFL